MSWAVVVDGYARKYLKRIPKKDVDNIKSALKELVYNPYAGDIEKMGGDKNVWRRRVGAYRLLYEIYENRQIVYVAEIKRRTSKTY